MNVSQQIQELIDSGMTQDLIAAKSQRHQYTVSRLANQKTKHPKWVDVNAIERLYEFVVIESNHWDDYVADDAPTTQQVEVN